MSARTHTANLNELSPLTFSSFVVTTAHSRLYSIGSGGHYYYYELAHKLRIERIPHDSLLTFF